MHIIFMIPFKVTVMVWTWFVGIFPGSMLLEVRFPVWQ